MTWRKSIYPKSAIANKGGRYWGKTTNPYNGTRYNDDGTPYVTNVRHQVLIFKDESINSDDYALIIHTNEETEETLSLRNSPVAYLKNTSLISSDQ